MKPSDFLSEADCGLRFLCSLCFFTHSVCCIKTGSWVRFLFVLFVLCCLWPGRVRAQVSGVVTDAETGTPLSSVNVYYRHDKRTGTVTDGQGRYTLTSNMAPGDLVFSYLGYLLREEKVKYGERRTLNVRLTPQHRELGEVTIKPRKQKYSRRNNPAVELMKKVIAAKGDNDLRRNDYCRYFKYSKLTFALNGLSPAESDSSLFRNLPLLAGQVEYCPQTGKNILPVTYSETLSEYLYRKRPEAERDYLRGEHSEGLNDLFSTGEMFTTVLRSVFTQVNIYDNSIFLLERPFTSPLSSVNAIAFYQYFIMDTLLVDGERCVELSFVPQNPQDFGFSGRLVVGADDYRVRRCVINLPLRTSVNFVNNLVIEQTFARQSNGQQVLVKDDMLAELGLVRKNRALLVKRRVAYSGWSFDSIPDVAFREREKLREGTCYMDDEAFWARHRTDTLTRSEANMKRMLAQARHTRGFGPMMFVARALVENYVETARPGKKNYVDIGPINTIVSTNFIEKFRLRASAQTTALLNPHWFFKGYLAYGFRDRKLKYEGQVEYSLLRKRYSPEEFPRNSIALSVRYDVATPGDFLSPRDKDNVFVSFKTQTVDQMMYFKNYTLKYEYEFDNTFGIRTQLRHTRQVPAGSLSYRTTAGCKVDELRTSEATLVLRYAPGEELVHSKQRRVRVNGSAPVFRLTHTVGLKGVWGSDYNYNYTELSAYKRFWFHSFGRLNVHARLGAQWNQVPFPLLIMPAANNSYIITENMFCLMNNMEFLTDRMASLDVEWDMNGKLFNRIPLLKRLKWREIVGCKTLYGALTRKNNPALHTSGNELFDFPVRDGIPMSRAMGDRPYMELNIGIYNIFKIIRIDYVRRLTYHGLPRVKKNGVRLALQFDF